jgi:tetrapyrrole methylase family protein/MazG family protein
MAPDAPPTVTVIGLGPAGADLLSPASLAAFEAHPPHRRWTRTDRHPAAAALGPHASFDDVYRTAERIEDVYDTIVDRLVSVARSDGPVCYAVPGSPLVAEHTVELLRTRSDVTVRIEPALSFADLAWARLGVDPFAAGVRFVDGHRFLEEAAGERGPLLVGQCDRDEVLTAVKLAVDEPGALTVTVLQRLGLPDEVVREVAWDDLDREIDPDHLTSLWIPQLAAPVAGELVRFAELVRVLRERCPWDSAQTHRSLRPFVIEEAYEVAEAIDHLPPDDGPDEYDDDGADGVDELEEELGDLLFQVVFHATLAAEQGWFTLADVARVVHDKLVRRHPHVFADVAVSGSAEVVANWEQIKDAEKGRTGPFDGIPAALPARLYAEKVLRRAARAGIAADLSAELAAAEAADAVLRAAAERLTREH